jgi:hypothetical protein
VLPAGRATACWLEPLRAPALTSFGVDSNGKLYAVTLAGRVYRFALA